MSLELVSVRRWQAEVPPDEALVRALLAEEGLEAFGWGNAAGEVYPPHVHGYDKVIYVIEGSIAFGLAEGRVSAAGRGPARSAGGRGARRHRRPAGRALPRSASLTSSDPIDPRSPGWRASICLEARPYPARFRRGRAATARGESGCPVMATLPRPNKRAVEPLVLLNPTRRREPTLRAR